MEIFSLWILKTLFQCFLAFSVSVGDLMPFSSLWQVSFLWGYWDIFFFFMLQILDSWSLSWCKSFSFIVPDAFRLDIWKSYVYYFFDNIPPTPCPYLSLSLLLLEYFMFWIKIIILLIFYFPSFLSPWPFVTLWEISLTLSFKPLNGFLTFAITFLISKDSYSLNVSF